MIFNSMFRGTNFPILAQCDDHLNKQMLLRSNYQSYLIGSDECLAFLVAK